jgi:hypothetical protein
VEEGSTMPENDNDNLPATPLRPGSLIDQALANLTVRQQRDLMERATEEALNLEVRARNMRLDSEQANHDIQRHIDGFQSLNKDGRFDSHHIKSEIKTASGRMTIESNRGVGARCFVATAVFMDEGHPTVETLRCFRDTVLVNTSYGRNFVAWYYREGPKLAGFVHKHGNLRPFLKIILSGMALIISKVTTRGAGV